jgi:Xaa-Pro aminopeptidase
VHTDSSEYLAKCDERRAFISGFNGSAGTMPGLTSFLMCVKDMLAGCAIVTVDNALLFTDGRYFLQAGKQLDELASSICLEVKVFG